MARGGGKRYPGVKVEVAKTFRVGDKVFDNPEDAYAYGQKDVYKGLLKMTDADINNILNGDDPKRADLITKLASKIRQNRINSPDYVPRPRKAKATLEGAQGNGMGEQAPL